MGLLSKNKFTGGGKLIEYFRFSQDFCEIVSEVGVAWHC